MVTITITWVPPLLVTCYILDGNSHHCNKANLAEMDVRGRKSEVGKNILASQASPVSETNLY
jgi:hypothetical protein